MISRRLLVLPRLFLGAIFAVAVFAKISGPAPFWISLGGFLHATAPSAHPLYREFETALLLPNAKALAYAVIAGESFVAIAMLFGVVTRLGALVASLLLLNYMLAKGAGMWTPSSNDAADMILAIVVGVGAAGRCYGLDAILAKRWPKVPIW